MKSVFGLPENIAAALSYVFGAFSGVVVLILERENKFVRFHALQSTLWFLFLYVVLAVVNFITTILSGIWVFGTLFGFVLSPISFFLWLVIVLSGLLLVVKAYGGAAFKLPIVGDAVWGQIYK
jgi:uncharacterized membrane protein